jgi:hypothetical protein
MWKVLYTPNFDHLSPGISALKVSFRSKPFVVLNLTCPFKDAALEGRI